MARFLIICAIVAAALGEPLPELRLKVNKPKNESAVSCIGEFCNPSYLPYPNMNAALYGYDLMKADPFSTSSVGGDPGWCRPIFVATVPATEDGQGAVKLHGSIEGKDTLQCNSRFEVTTVRTLKEYKKSQLNSLYSGYDLALGNEVTVNVGVSVPVKAAEVSASAETTIPPFLRRSSSSVESEAQLTQFFSNEGGSMVQMEATCSVQVIDVLPYSVPQFHQSFADGVAQLAAVAASGSEGAKEAAFKKFIEHYGTHYSARTTMGSKLIYQMRVTEKEKSKDSKSDIKNCAEKQGLKIFGFQVEEDKKECKNSETYENDLESSSVTRQRFASFGSTPEKDLSSWHQQEFEKPMPLKMELKPLPELFTPQNIAEISKLTKQEIDQAQFTNWFVKDMYSRVCEIVYGKAECNKKRTGCGLNDDCKWDQDCENVDNDAGFVCKDKLNPRPACTEKEVRFDMPFPGFIYMGHGLKAGQFVKSFDGKATLKLGCDGNLVLLDKGNRVWQSATSDGYKLEVHEYGELIMRNYEGETVWHIPRKCIMDMPTMDEAPAALWLIPFPIKKLGGKYAVVITCTSDMSTWKKSRWIMEGTPDGKNISPSYIED